ncbi:MAG: GTPase ObgE [Firmicutes bacterium]|nr:GTPase ObgE [Bacillota bacterium]
MFIDEVSLIIKSGKGGDGIIAFRREKHVPLGGPSGGDGGKGGSIIFEADNGLSTLFDLRYQKHIFASAGDNGKNKNMRGKDAEDVIVKVPVGTIVYEEDTNRVLCDLTLHKEQKVVAKGGKGGRGNATFSSPRNSAPRIQENGEPGIALNLRVELKLLADVGIIGFPSVGKSTLISVVSGSKPKIADYPFTTIVPNLGVVDMDGVKSFVLADMPGLIEGASSGLGLGIQFLRHIERTRVLLHMIDMSPNSLRDAYEDYKIINKELETYKYHLISRPQIIVANKMDVPGAYENLEKFKKQIKEDIEIIPISAITKEGCKFLMQKTVTLLDQTPLFLLFEDLEISENVLYQMESLGPLFTIVKVNETTFEVTGQKIDQLLSRSNFMTDEAVLRFLRQLRKIGLDEDLKRAGAKNKDLIKISDFEFEFVE